VNRSATEEFYGFTTAACTELAFCRNFSLPCTSSVFFECIDVTPAARQAGNDIKGRLWDILQVMRHAVRKNGSEPTTGLFFDVLVVRDRIKPRLTKLKVVAGPDDDGRPCLTVMFPDED
jgi:hypothetical protein